VCCEGKAGFTSLTAATSDRTDQALAALREQWGGRREVWYVPHAKDGSVTWCARRHGDELRNVLHAYRPEQLAEYLTDAEGRAPEPRPSAR
jgi:hypothetical protein